MNKSVDLYLEEGCGRCKFYRTLQCKVHAWSEELKLLRKIVLDCGLQEDIKWSQPCYTHQKHNILLVTAFKEYAALAFFKGSLLKDPHQILIAPGEHSQATRQLRFTNTKEIAELEPILTSYVYEAIEVEKAGLKVKFNRNPEPLPVELQDSFEENPQFKTAFEALTPGRQRGYILYFSQAKQSATRISRIEKSMEKIREGKGLQD